MKNPNKITIFLLLFIILAGIYLRVYNLDKPSFWVDELDFVYAAKSMSEVGRPLLNSGYPYSRAPLVTYSLMASFKLFGISEFSARLPVAIFGVLSIPLLYLIGRSFFGKRVGLLAALFLTFSPLAIGLSRTCRMYSLFQFLFLAGVYFFYLGFEARDKSNNMAASRQRRIYFAPFTKILERWQIHLPMLSLGGLFLLLAYITHQNAGLFLLSLMGYLAACWIFLSIKGGIKSFPTEKYVVPLGVIILMGLLAYLINPEVHNFIVHAVTYLPKWAEVDSAQNPWLIFDFLFTSMETVPFNLLFVLGTLLLIVNKNKAGLYTLLTFWVPVLAFSFLFQYRKNDYIFHVFPIFFLVSAYALDRVIGFTHLIFASWKSAQRISNKLTDSQFTNWLSTLLLLIWIPITPAFLFAQKIPRLPDGHFNGAKYHNEWKQAADFLQDKLDQNDVIISTLPQTIQYYTGRAEYNLNWHYADQARRSKIYAPDGCLIDFYSGADVIEDLDELKTIFIRHRKGWIIVDNYRFRNPVYVPENIQQYLVNYVTKSFETKRGTVSIYRWN